MDRAVRAQKSFAQEIELSTILHFYSCAIGLIGIVLKFLAPFSPRLASQLEGRRELRSTALSIARLRSKFSKCVVFFCSSSGEFEQAKPLIDRLNKTGECFSHVFFFSRSGLDYARARKETVSYSLAPIDTVWNWGWMLSAARPDCSIVVRHEWWPGFLATAHEWSPVWLINAVSTGNHAGRGSSIVRLLNQLVRKWLARFFDRIYVVDTIDLDAFTKDLGRPAPITSPIGDTKYDRVFERSQEKNIAASGSKDIIQSKVPGRYFVAGSVYPEDLNIIVPTFAKSDTLNSTWALILVPHHPKPEVIAAARAQCKEAGLKATVLSELAADGPVPGIEDSSKGRVLIVDSMGQLAELYAIGEIAYVGGAMHSKVHNVLEPAAHGLALCCGPFYKNSREAIRLKELGVITIASNNVELETWWIKSTINTAEERQIVRQSVNRRVTALCGASDVLYAALEELLFKNPRKNSDAR